MKRLPTLEASAKLLTNLLGRPVAARKAGAAPLHPGPRTVTAVYVDDGGRLAAACVSDLAMAAHAGAALTMVPAATVAQAVSSGTLDPALLENFREVLNICSQLFNDLSEEHVRLAEVFTGRPAAPAAADALSSAATLRLELGVEVPGYGAGRMTLCSFPQQS